MSVMHEDRGQRLSGSFGPAIIALSPPPDSEDQFQMLFSGPFEKKNQPSARNLYKSSTPPGWRGPDLPKCHRATLLFTRALQVLVFPDPSTRQRLEAAGLHITARDRMSSNITRLVVQGCKGGRHPVIIHGHKEVWQEPQ